MYKDTVPCSHLAQGEALLYKTDLGKVVIFYIIEYLEEHVMY